MTKDDGDMDHSIISRARQERYLVALCGSIMVLVGWLMFGAASDARDFSLPGALIFATGWMFLTWVLTDGASAKRRQLGYASVATLVAMLSLAAPMLYRRRTWMFALSWSLFIAASSAMTYVMARDAGNRERAVQSVVVMGLVVLGVVAQFSERRLNIAWVFSGDPNANHSVFSFGTAMLSVGFAMVPGLAAEA